LRVRSFFARLLIAVMLLAALPAQAASPGTAATGEPTTYRKEKLHPILRQQVDAAANDATFTVVIKGRDEAQLSAVQFRTDDAVAAMKAAAARSQAPIVSHLRSRGAQVLNQLWLVNAVVARVNKATLSSLLNLQQVELVYDNFRVQAPPVRRAAVTPAGHGDLTWGLAKIQAERVWQEFGTSGEGIRVAVLDTGVDLNHPDIAGKMHSDNPGDPTYPGGWVEFDDAGNPVAGSAPHDSDAHGTHTSGTVVGGDASGTHIGVAPGATLMHGLVLPGGGGSFAQVVAGMQWAVQPVDGNGNPAGQRAHIASMSFGADGLRSEVIEAIRNMYAAGVLPIAAMGNCGEGCVGSPGAVYEAFGIGASADDDSIADFSSGGIISKSGWENPPAEWPDQWVKPDISAPGAGVLSATPGGGYEAWDGTSMATPHAAGTAALMLAANPNLTPDLILQTLQESSYWDNRYGEDRPNIRYGHGRIDAYEAVSRIAYSSGISGVVTDGATGAPLGQATITAEGLGRSAKSKADGSFGLVLPDGTYTLRVERFGYAPLVLPNIIVADDGYTTANAALQALPSGRVSGRVIYERTGHGIPGAAIQVLGIPIKIEATTDADGAYALDLPIGTYTLDASAMGFERRKATDVVVTDGGVTTQDVALQTLPRVAVIGDVEEMIVRFLGENGYLGEQVWFDVARRIGDYNLVIINLPGAAKPDEFYALMDAAEAAGVGIIFTKGYWYGWGIDLLTDYYGDPATSSFDWFPTPLMGRVGSEHPDLLPGRAAGDVFEVMPGFLDIGYFADYSGTTAVSFFNDVRDPIGGGVGYKQNAGNRHVLLAALGVVPWQSPSSWSEDARQIFLNAVRWAARPEAGGAKLVPFNLQVSPDAVLWNETVDITVSVKNIGDAAAQTSVEPWVNGEPIPGQALSLAPGQHQTAAFMVQRETVGAYRVDVGHLSATFRVRPPRVTVSASTIYLPPSGKGRNADPGEPAIPLAGAQVDLIRAGKLISRGNLDDQGRLTFDSTASRDAYTIVIRHSGYGYNRARGYLLTMPVNVEGDVSYTIAPSAAGTAQVDVTMAQRSASHHGSVFVSGGALGKAAYEFPTGQLVITPGAYQVAPLMAYDVPGAQWAYAGKYESVTLAAGPQTFAFGGDLRLTLADVKGQQAPQAAANWSMTDGHGRAMAAIYQVTAGAFGPTHSRTVADRSAWPATVAATAQQVIKPVLTLTNPFGAIEQTGPIGWAEQPRAISFEPARVLPGEYGLRLQSDTGPYGGVLQAAAKLMLPARSLSRTVLMPNDTFDVTVVFDAGTSGQMSLAETLPPGFTVTRQSSTPNATFAGGTWTWQASGKGAYKPGQTVRVTYTVKVGASVAAGTYSLAGAVTQGGAARAVAGPGAVSVVR
jgi:subtilisin family serine protease